MRRERALEVIQKGFFIIFIGLSVAKNCLRPESTPLTASNYKSASGHLQNNSVNGARLITNNRVVITKIIKTIIIVIIMIMITKIIIF